MIDHASETLADGGISVAFQRQCPNIYVTESDVLGSSGVPDEVAYHVSYRADFTRGLNGNVGNLKVTHQGVVFYAEHGQLPSLARGACFKILGKQEPTTEKSRRSAKGEQTTEDQGGSQNTAAVSQLSNSNESVGVSGGLVSESTLSHDEKESLESACSHAKYLEGPASYNRCKETQLRLLARGTSYPDLSGLSPSEKISIQSACSQPKYLEGPAAYDRCLQDKLQSLTGSPRQPDLSGLSASEKQSIESACSQAKYLEGPASYNRCLVNQLGLLGRNRP